MAISRDRTPYDCVWCRTPAHPLALPGERWTGVSTAAVQVRETCSIGHIMTGTQVPASPAGMQWTNAGKRPAASFAWSG